MWKPATPRHDQKVPRQVKEEVEEEWFIARLEKLEEWVSRGDTESVHDNLFVKYNALKEKVHMCFLLKTFLFWHINMKINKSTLQCTGKKRFYKRLLY